MIKGEGLMVIGSNDRNRRFGTEFQIGIATIQPASGYDPDKSTEMPAYRKCQPTENASLQKYQPTEMSVYRKYQPTEIPAYRNVSLRKMPAYRNVSVYRKMHLPTEESICQWKCVSLQKNPSAYRNLPAYKKKHRPTEMVCKKISELYRLVSTLNTIHGIPFNLY